MKRFVLSFLLFILTTLPSLDVKAQDNDDLYFDSGDRALFEKNNPIEKKEKLKSKSDSLNSHPSIAALTWRLNCTGLSSGNSKNFTGFSKNFYDAPKLLEDSLKTLYRNEKIAIEFTFDSTNVLLTDTIDFKEIKDFFSLRMKDLSSCEKMSFNYPEWLTPLVVDKQTHFLIDRTFEAPEGDASLKITGSKNGTICSFSKYFKNEYSNSFVSVKSPESGADKTWIFFYAYGSGDSTDLLRLMIYQTVYKKGSTVTILQKSFVYSIPLDFNGWRSIAVRYSDFNIPEGTPDNTERIPKDLASLEFSLVNQAPTGEATIYLDQLMILSDQ